jgi:hypothetical protein
MKNEVKIPFQKKQMKAKLATLTLLAGVCLFAGCSQENANDKQVADALNCLDHATNASTADVCVAKVSGIQTPQAYLIRCSADFIAQGLTGSRLATAFQQQKGSTVGGSNQTIAMAAYLVFDSSITNHTAAITTSDCNQSNEPSVIGLASMVSVATNLAQAASALGGPSFSNLNPSNIGSFDPTAIKTVADSLYADLQSGHPIQASVDAENAIGQAAITAQAAYCSPGSSFVGQDVCNKLNNAIQAGNNIPTNIGFTLLGLLQ